jgi:hypothetical protein
MKINQKKLKQIIQEEIQAMVRESDETEWYEKEYGRYEKGTWDPNRPKEGSWGGPDPEADPIEREGGGSSPEEYVPFEGLSSISKEDIKKELAEIAATFGLSDEDVKRMLKAQLDKAPGAMKENMKEGLIAGGASLALFIWGVKQLVAILQS